MLTNEILQADAQLKELTPDQLKAITTLSANDENVVIGKKIGEIHGDYDRDIKEVLGVEKPQGMKTYDFIKNDLLLKIKDADTLATTNAATLKEQTDKVAQLELAIADKSGDIVLTQQLKDASDKIDQLNLAHEEDKKTWTETGDKTKSELMDLRLTHEFDKGLSGVKYKDEKIVSVGLRNLAIKQGREAVLRDFTPDFIDDGANGTTLVFRDKDGTIQNNPENSLKPYTATELLMKQAGVNDVIDAGKNLNGGAGGDGGSPKPVAASIGAAATQVEADDIISKDLMGQGLSRDSVEFAEKHAELRKEANVGELPLR